MSSAIEGGAPTRARQTRPGVVLLSAIAGGVLGIALLGHRFKSLSQERRQIKLALLDLAQAERDADAPPLLASLAELTGQLALVRAELSSCVMSEGSLREWIDRADQDIAVQGLHLAISRGQSRPVPGLNGLAICPLELEVLPVSPGTESVGAPLMALRLCRQWSESQLGLEVLQMGFHDHAESGLSASIVLNVWLRAANP